VLYPILTSLAIVAVFVAVAAWFVGFTAVARATRYRASQLLSTEVKALQRPGIATTAEKADRSVGDLKRRTWKSMLVFMVALASAAGLTFLRNWATGRSG
jgi:hypothetical protein